LSRWSKSGVLQEAFLCLQKTGAIRIKRFRRVFTRYDKLDSIFSAFVLLTLIVDALVKC
jgi:hypothetical protein